MVNISSLLAVQPHCYFGLYCTSKAARDMFHRAISQDYVGKVISSSLFPFSFSHVIHLPLLGRGEVFQDPKVCKTLNYAPGALDNDMGRVVRESSGDLDLRRQHEEAKKKVTLYDKIYFFFF
jgi:hypothetical protein